MPTVSRRRKGAAHRTTKFHSAPSASESSESAYREPLTHGEFLKYGTEVAESHGVIRRNEGSGSVRPVTHLAFLHRGFSEEPMRILRSKVHRVGVVSRSKWSSVSIVTLKRRDEDVKGNPTRSKDGHTVD